MTATKSRTLLPWHVGCVVENMAAAMADHRRLSAVAFSETAVLHSHSYDAQSHTVHADELQVAFVRHGDGTVFELICPVGPDGTSPRRRFLSERPGPTHVALWCDEFIPAATDLIDQGAEIVMGALNDGDQTDNALAAQTAEQLLTVCVTCYLRLKGGLMVELNPASSYSNLPDTCGESIREVVDPPPAFFG